MKIKKEKRNEVCVCDLHVLLAAAAVPLVIHTQFLFRCESLHAKVHIHARLLVVLLR